jgi:hypothetical protein
VKSVRLGEPLQSRLRLAAVASRASESEIIRQAVARRVDEILGVSVYDQIRDLIVEGGGRPGGARTSDEQVAEEIAADARRHRRVLPTRS